MAIQPGTGKHMKGVIQSPVFKTDGSVQDPRSPLLVRRGLPSPLAGHCREFRPAGYPILDIYRFIWVPILCLNPGLNSISVNDPSFLYFYLFIVVKPPTRSILSKEK